MGIFLLDRDIFLLVHKFVCSKPICAFYHLTSTKRKLHDNDHQSLVVDIGLLRCVCRQWMHVLATTQTFAVLVKPASINLKMFNYLSCPGDRIMSLYLDGCMEINGRMLRHVLPALKVLQFLSVIGCGLAPGFVVDLPRILPTLCLVDITGCKTISTMFNKHDCKNLVRNLQLTQSRLRIKVHGDESYNWRFFAPRTHLLRDRCFHIDASLYYIVNCYACTCLMTTKISCIQYCLQTGVAINNTPVMCNKHSAL